MKTFAILIGLAYVVISAVALSQAHADTPPPLKASATPVAIAADAAPSDEVLEEATTPQARKMMLLRCSGPPPKPPAKIAEASEPATHETATPARSE